MKNRTSWYLVVGVIGISCSLLATSLWAQRTNRGQRNNQPDQQDPNATTDQGQDKEEPEEPTVTLPDDEKLLDVHRHFVREAEKLADSYIKANKMDQARAVYEEIVRLVPSYPKGKEMLKSVKEKQATLEKKIITVMANEEWQDTGITVAEGKPVVISAPGTWNFRLSHDADADGIELPKDLRDFNLGALVGKIEDGGKDVKPFVIGAYMDFTSEKTGRLMLRMYDAAPGDNVGKIQVTISGSFAAGGTKVRAPRPGK